MSLTQLSFTMKLDHAYEAGVIAFISAENLLIPVRERDDIHVRDTGEVVVHFCHHWLAVRHDQIKFIRRQ